MSLQTSFGLSLRNLATKKARTFLTAFAGSIGIIGIALVLSLSTGIQDYVNKMQNDTLMAYPLSIEKESLDLTSLTAAFSGTAVMGKVDHEMDKIYTNKLVSDVINSFVSQSGANNIGAFKKYVEDNREKFDELCNDIQYKYLTPLNVYRADTTEGLVQVNPNKLLDNFQNADLLETVQNFTSADMSLWRELIGDNDVLSNHFEMIYGRLPENKNEVVLIVDVNNEANDLLLYALGIKDQSQFSSDLMSAIAGGEEYVTEQVGYTYEEICNLKYKLVLNYQYMTQDKKTGLWSDASSNQMYVKQLVNEGLDISIVGIVKPHKDNALSVATSCVGYTTELMDYAIEQTKNSQIVQQQLNNPDIDVITGKKFVKIGVNDFDLKDIDFNKIDLKYLDLSPFMSLVENIDISELQKKMIEGYLNDDQVLALKQAYIDTITADASYDSTMLKLGYGDTNKPASIYFYPKTFDKKDQLLEMIDYYNEKVTADGHKEYTIEPTDAIGALLTSVTQIIDIVTIVLIVFIAISLVVSSIMIGIITYISVLERTKEIGILRSIGASKSDVSSVFNAETVTIGIASGVIGIVSTLLLQIPINLLLNHFTNTGAAAHLPFGAAIVLILISASLTFIAGLVPSSIAAKKDPVEALRTE